MNHMPSLSAYLEAVSLVAVDPGSVGPMYDYFTMVKSIMADLVPLVLVAGMVSVLKSFASGGSQTRRANADAMSLKRAEAIVSKAKARQEKYQGRRAVRQDSKLDIRAEYEKAQKTRSEIADLYAEIAFDPIQAFQLPELMSTSCSESQAFYEALYDSTPFDAWPGERLAEEFIRKVDVLAETWAIALAHAKSTKMDGLDEDIQSDLRKAVKLLQHAQRTSGPESQSHTDKAMAILDRITNDESNHLRSSGDVREILERVAPLALERRVALQAP